MGAMVFLVLISWAICGLVAAGVWQSKGGSYGAGFWLGAVLGFLGLFYVAFAQPDERRTMSSEASYVGGTALTRPRNPATKTCPRCAEDVKSAAAVCRFCGYEFPVVAFEAQPPAHELDVFEGAEISDIREHAFGVLWGKTPNAEVVYKESEAGPWVIFDKTKTGLVPPAGYLTSPKPSPLA